jgi:hypothetical protein
MEELNLIDADDLGKVDQATSGTPEQRLHEVICELAKSLPGTTKELWPFIIGRMERHHGSPWVRAFVLLFALSGEGWREADLLILLPRVARVLDSTLLDEPNLLLKLATLRRAFRTHLTIRGNQRDGIQQLWDFSHSDMKSPLSITQSLLHGGGLRSTRSTNQASFSDQKANAEGIEKLSRVVLDHLLTLPEGDPIRANEFLYHALGRFCTSPRSTASLNKIEA